MKMETAVGGKEETLYGNLCADWIWYGYIKI